MDKDYQKILGSVQKPVIGEAGKTGTWSNLKPVIDDNKCIPAKSGIEPEGELCHPKSP